MLEPIFADIRIKTGPITGAAVGTKIFEPAFGIEATTRWSCLSAVHATRQKRRKSAEARGKKGLCFTVI